MDCPTWIIMLASFGAICAVSLPLWALYVFAIEHFTQRNEDELAE